MIISNGSVVSFHYTLKDEAGTQLESNRDTDPQLALIGRRNILPGLEEVLQGKAAGEQLVITLPPEKAYGLRRPDAEQRVPMKHLIKPPKKLMPGEIVTVNTPDGVRHGRVIKVGRFNVDIDSNHPFAGETLTFEIDIHEVREASRDELAHGHAHGVGGHHH